MFLVNLIFYDETADGDQESCEVQIRQSDVRPEVICVEFMRRSGSHELFHKVWPKLNQFALQNLENI